MVKDSYEINFCIVYLQVNYFNFFSEPITKNIKIVKIWGDQTCFTTQLGPKIWGDLNFSWGDLDPAGHHGYLLVEKYRTPVVVPPCPKLSNVPELK